VEADYICALAASSLHIRISSTPYAKV